MEGIPSHEKSLHTAAVVALCHERRFQLLSVPSSARLEVLRCLAVYWVVASLQWEFHSRDH